MTHYTRVTTALKNASTVAEIATVEVAAARLGAEGKISQPDMVQFYGACVERKLEILVWGHSPASGDSAELEAAFEQAKAS